jgi:hypothetical protein
MSTWLEAPGDGFPDGWIRQILGDNQPILSGSGAVNYWKYRHTLRISHTGVVLYGGGQAGISNICLVRIQHSLQGVVFQEVNEVTGALE